MGQDVTEIALTMFQSNPWAVFSSLFKIFFFINILGTLILRLSIFHPTFSLKNKVATFFLFIFSLISTYLGIFYEYPAFFENVLPLFLQKIIFTTALYISPNYFFAASLICLILVLIIHIQNKQRSRFFYTVSFLSVAVFFISKEIFDYFSLYQMALKKNPLVIQIAIDSFRYDRLNRKEVIPHISELLNDNQTVLFSDHIVGIPRTFPSWVEMLSGKYTMENNIRHMFPNHSSRQSLPDGIIHKTKKDPLNFYHVMISDFAGDIFPRFNTGADEVLTPTLNISSLIKQGIAQSLPLYLPLFILPWTIDFFIELKESPLLSDPMQITQKAIRKISQKLSDQPLFLTLFFSTAHFPYAAPHPGYKKFSPENYSGNFLFQKNPPLNFGEENLSEKEIAKIRSLYDGALWSIDQSLGALFYFLKKNQILDQTLISITGDHGEFLYESDFFQGHGEQLYGEHVLHVPWILTLPDPFIVQKKEIVTTTRTIDIPKTLFSLTQDWITQDHKIEKELDTTQGVDLRSSFLSLNDPFPSLPAYSETGIWFSRHGRGRFQDERLDYPSISGLLDFDAGYGGEITLSPNFESIIKSAKHRSIIKDQWKLIYIPTKDKISFKLFDRFQDPENRLDISSKNPKTLQELKDYFWKIVLEKENQINLYDGYIFYD